MTENAGEVIVATITKGPEPQIQVFFAAMEALRAVGKPHAVTIRPVRYHTGETYGYVVDLVALKDEI